MSLTHKLTRAVVLVSDWPALFQAQIHLIGNPVSWGVANLSLLAYQLLAAAYTLRRRRGFKDLTDGRVSWQVLESGPVLVCGSDPAGCLQMRGSSLFL